MSQKSRRHVKQKKIRCKSNWSAQDIIKRFDGTFLKEKIHQNATEFCENLLKHYDEYILHVEDYFHIGCIDMQCCNSCIVISGYTSLGKYYLDVAVPNSKAASQ